jgi:hypothetical protein
MVQRREQPRFTIEADAPIAIREERLREHLDRDVTSELQVAGAIHLTHAAGPEDRGDGVGADLRPDHRGPCYSEMRAAGA